jgi:hypothetical protein
MEVRTGIKMDLLVSTSLASSQSQLRPHNVNNVKSDGEGVAGRRVYAGLS